MISGLIDFRVGRVTRVVVMATETTVITTLDLEVRREVEGTVNSSITTTIMVVEGTTGASTTRVEILSLICLLEGLICLVVAALRP